MLAIGASLAGCGNNNASSANKDDSKKTTQSTKDTSGKTSQASNTKVSKSEKEIQGVFTKFVDYSYNVNPSNVQQKYTECAKGVTYNGKKIYSEDMIQDIQNHKITLSKPTFKGDIKVTFIEDGEMPDGKKLKQAYADYTVIHYQNDQKITETFRGIAVLNDTNQKWEVLNTYRR